MANKTVKDLPQADTIRDADLLLLEQADATRSVSVQEIGGHIGGGVLKQADQKYGPAIIGTAQGAPVQITDAWTGAALHRLAVIGQSAETPVAGGQVADKGPENPVAITGSAPDSITVSADSEEAIMLPAALELHDLLDRDGAPWIWDEYDAASGKLLRRIGQVVLSGTENWVLWKDNGETVSYYLPLAGTSIQAATENKGLRTTHFSPTYTSGQYYSIQTGREAFGLSPDARNFAVCVQKSVAADLAEWKVWLAAHPVTVYYPLAEPEISQLAQPQEIVPRALTLQVAADVGAVAVEYTRDGTTYIEREISKLSAMRRYGCRRPLSSTDPSCERIWDAAGLQASVGGDDLLMRINDFDGVWPWCDIRICNIRVNDVGVVVTAYEGDPRFSRDGSNGEVAVEIPKFYQPPRRPGDGYEYFGASNTQLDGWTLNPCFAASEVELEKIYVSCYEAYYNAETETITRTDGSTYSLPPGLHSISGVLPTTGLARGDFRRHARSSGCSLYDMACLDVIATLFTVEYATLDSQSIMQGVVSLSSGSMVATGTTDNLSASSGSPVSNTDGEHACMYRGLENLWGNSWKWVDGVNIEDHRAWICSDPDSYADAIYGAPYTALKYMNSKTNGYTKSLGCDNRFPWARLPVDTAGSSTTGYCDYYYQGTGRRAPITGGNTYSNTNAGLWCLNLGNSATYAGANFGARLVWR